MCSSSRFPDTSQLLHLVLTQRNKSSLMLVENPAVLGYREVWTAQKRVCVLTLFAVIGVEEVPRDTCIVKYDVLEKVSK